MTAAKHEGAEPGTAAGIAYVVIGLSKVYRAKSGDVTATDDIDLEVRCGEVFGLLGPNGAGKTTLVRQLIGLLRPDAGRIELFGHDVVAQPRVVPDFVAYLPQDDGALSDQSTSVALETTARLRGLTRSQARSARDDTITELALEGFVDRPIA